MQKVFRLVEVCLIAVALTMAVRFVSPQTVAVVNATLQSMR